MKYEFKKDDAFGFASAHGFEIRHKGDELQFKECPYCRGGMHHDYWTFSVNAVSGAFKCLRASCDRQGHFLQLCRDYNYRVQEERPAIFKRLPQKRPDSSAAAIAYLESRGISAEVSQRYNVTSKKDNPKILVFPFYDDHNELTFLKYRNTAFRKGVDKNKEWCEKNTMPILFGMNHCKDFERLIITEGQIDGLSVVQAGFDNVVSVPMGATNFAWLNYCYSWITQFKEIIVFGDCEKGKITLLDTLQARLPKEIIIKAVRIVDYLQEKDANDILCSYGWKAVRQCVESAEIPKLNNVKMLSDVQSVDINNLDKIQTGINELDRVVRGFAMGQLVILTGKRGEGKSTFMSQIICAALQQKRTVFAYSGELADFHFKRWIDYQLARSVNIIETVDRDGIKDYSIKAETVKQINQWYRGRAYIYDNNYLPDGAELETLPDTIEKVILKYNAQLICIDNLMTAMERVNDQNNLYLAQSNFVGKLKAIAQKYCVVIILVAHPRKGGTDSAADDNDLIAGSADISNKADIVIKYERNTDESIDADGLIKVTKNRLFGVLRTKKADAIQVNYNPKTRRITDVNDHGEKVYGWEFIAQRQQKTADELPF